MKRWSKLQRKLYSITIKAFQIHVAKYSQNGQTAKATNLLPRYWITVGKEIVFDYPTMFEDKGYYPWTDDMSNISEIIFNYIVCEKECLLNYHDINDRYGLIDILKACDKRIGKRRLEELKGFISNPYALKIIEQRQRGEIS